MRRPLLAEDRPPSSDLPRAHQERPRERMLVHGPDQLGEVELVALLLGGGKATARARAAIDACGGLRGLAGACPQELCEVPGIGAAGATAIAAAVELGRRIGRAGLPWADALRCPVDVADFVRATLRGATQEIFLAIGLDARQRVRLVRRVAQGSLAQVEVHPRELFRPLVRAGMHSCVIAHNHPSGAPEPSGADIELTRRMVEVGRLLGIPVLDHLVVTDDDHVSLAARGLVPA